MKKAKNVGMIGKNIGAAIARNIVQRHNQEKEAAELKLAELKSKLKNVWDDWQENWLEVPNPHVCLYGMLNWHTSDTRCEAIPVKDLTPERLLPYEYSPVIILAPEESPETGYFAEATFILQEDNWTTFRKKAENYYEEAEEGWAFMIIAFKK